MTEIRVESQESFRVHWYSANVARGKKQMSAYGGNLVKCNCDWGKQTYNPQSPGAGNKGKPEFDPM